MKKLNNKGFAISGILYSIMVLFLMLLLSILGILGSRKATLDKSKKDVLESLNSKYANSSFNFKHRDITIINRGNKDDIMYALMDGVTAIDENGNSIDKSNISYDLDINNLENKDYIVTYTTSSNNQNIIGTRKIRFIDNDIVNTFLYTGDEQVFSASNNGSYKVELWGASGGLNDNTLADSFGRGSYTRGMINLTLGNSLYLYVGGSGVNPIKSDGYCSAEGGYNGGGGGESSGGGATDIRLINGSWNDFNGLKSRIMVAAGGGGGGYNNVSSIISRGDGGTLNGMNSKLEYRETTDYSGFGATQISGGEPGTLFSGRIDPVKTDTMVGKFGMGGYSLNAAGHYEYTSSGGGGGYYGGGHGNHPGSSWTGAGGGSSFISGYDGCDAIAESSTSDNIIHTGQSVHYTGYKFENSIMLAGNESMPEHRGNGTMIGNTGNGYAKISLIYYY